MENVATPELPSPGADPLVDVVKRLAEKYGATYDETRDKLAKVLGFALDAKRFAEEFSDLVPRELGPLLEEYARALGFERVRGPAEDATGTTNIPQQVVLARATVGGGEARLIECHATSYTKSGAPRMMMSRRVAVDAFSDSADDLMVLARALERFSMRVVREQPAAEFLRRE